MNLSNALQAVPAAAMAGLLATTTACPAGGDSQGVQDLPRIAGEQLPPSALGEIHIETMEEMAARDRANPIKPVLPGRARIGYDGAWVIPTERLTHYPHSGWHYAINKGGDTSMGIAFPEVVDVKGVWIAGQGQREVWAPAVMVIGYRDGREIAQTDWFDLTTDRPNWFEIGLEGVDRIVFKAQPSAQVESAGWYSIDDFTYRPAGQNRQVVIDFEDCHYKDKLTGSDYAGLTWEAGTSPRPRGFILPAPAEPPARERVPAPGDETPPGDPLGMAATLPDMVDDFIGVKRGDLNQWSLPPDTCGAVGPNHYVEIVNSNLCVFSKTGSVLYHISLGAFMPGTSGDPRILFDQHSGRWIAISTNFYKNIYINISLTDDPTGAWYKTYWVAATGSDAACWVDYPTLGVNDEGIFVACGMFNYCGITIFAIDKAPFLEDPPSWGTVTAWRGNSLYEHCIQPSHTYGDPGKEYLLSLHPTYNNRLFMRSIQGPMTSPTLSGPYNIAIPAWAPKYTAPALGSPVEIETVSPRLMNAVYRNGYIWTAHTVYIGGRAACRWYEVFPDNYSAQTGYVYDSVLHYYMPSVTVNANGDAVMGFTGSSPDQYCGAYYTGRKHSDPVGQMAVPFQYKLGQASYYAIDNQGRNRWGDYSLCTVDPVDDLIMWTIQEYAYSSAGTDRWGTWIAQLEYQVGPDNDNCWDAPLIFDGSHSFTNVDATTDGPTEVGECGVLENDVWFRYGASCDGEATVDLCSADFDTVVAIYGSNCPSDPGEIIACNDDYCGSQSLVTFPVVGGTIYTIRVGGGGGAMGSGTMEISCGEEPDCPADVNTDGVVDIDDLFEVLAHWGEGAGVYDINEDGIVDIDDVFEVLAAWGPC
ncbi:MAG: hypothetical protein JSV91_04325 [Phycisphaerales bacterium]|nr:MAG: hypothetical protein JSV91_04325 [Phycisphaerales bacterium]